jgi:hypothetical protein
MNYFKLLLLLIIVFISLFSLSLSTNDLDFCQNIRIKKINKNEVGYYNNTLEFLEDFSKVYQKVQLNNNDNNILYMDQISEIYNLTTIKIVINCFENDYDNILFQEINSNLKLEYIRKYKYLEQIHNAFEILQHKQGFMPCLKIILEEHALNYTYGENILHERHVKWRKFYHNYCFGVLFISQISNRLFGTDPLYFLKDINWNYNEEKEYEYSKKDEIESISIPNNQNIIHKYVNNYNNYHNPQFNSQNEENTEEWFLKMLQDNELNIQKININKKQVKLEDDKKRAKNQLNNIYLFSLKKFLDRIQNVFLNKTGLENNEKEKYFEEKYKENNNIIVQTVETIDFVSDLLKGNNPYIISLQEIWNRPTAKILKTVVNSVVKSIDEKKNDEKFMKKLNRLTSSGKTLLEVAPYHLYRVYKYATYKYEAILDFESSVSKYQTLEKQLFYHNTGKKLKDLNSVRSRIKTITDYIHITSSNKIDSDEKRSFWHLKNDKRFNIYYEELSAENIKLNKNRKIHFKKSIENNPIEYNDISYIKEIENIHKEVMEMEKELEYLKSNIQHKAKYIMFMHNIYDLNSQPYSSDEYEWHNGILNRMSELRNNIYFNEEEESELELSRFHYIIENLIKNNQQNDEKNMIYNLRVLSKKKFVTSSDSCYNRGDTLPEYNNGLCQYSTCCYIESYPNPNGFNLLPECSKYNMSLDYQDSTTGELQTAYFEKDICPNWKAGDCHSETCGLNIFNIQWICPLPWTGPNGVMGPPCCCDDFITFFNYTRVLFENAFYYLTQKNCSDCTVCQRYEPDGTLMPERACFGYFPQDFACSSTYCSTGVNQEVQLIPGTWFPLLPWSLFQVPLDSNGSFNITSVSVFGTFIGTCPSDMIDPFGWFQWFIRIWLGIEIELILIPFINSITINNIINPFKLSFLKYITPDLFNNYYPLAPISDYLIIFTWKATPGYTLAPDLFFCLVYNSFWGVTALFGTILFFKVIISNCGDLVTHIFKAPLLFLDVYDFLLAVSGSGTMSQDIVNEKLKGYANKYGLNSQLLKNRVKNAKKVMQESQAKFREIINSNKNNLQKNENNNNTNNTNKNNNTNNINKKKILNNKKNINNKK